MDLIFSFLGQMFIYGLVAIFLENSLLSRAMGSSTAVWLMRDHRLLLPFGAVLTATILLSSIAAYFITPWVNQFVYSYELFPLAYSVIICLFYLIAVLATSKVKQPRKKDLRLCIHRSALNSVVLGNNRIFGYRKENKRLVIDEDQAPMVRELFELYATGQYSMKQIETLFWEKGYSNHNGKKIAHTTMSGMISNPKYKGYYVGNKVKVIDLFTKKQKFLPPEEWVMFKDETGEIVPAIVDEALWEQANRVLKKRSEDVKGRQGVCNHANLLTGKLFCTDCGTAYYRRESVDKQGRKNSKWVCSGKIKNGADACASFPIYEEEIKPLLFEVFSETEADAEALIEEYIEMYKSLADGGDTAKQIAALRDQADLAHKKKSKLLGYNAAGQLSDRDFLSMNKECDKEISEAERQIYELEQQQLSRDEFRKHIDTIRRVLHDAFTKEGIDIHGISVASTFENALKMTRRYLKLQEEPEAKKETAE